MKDESFDSDDEEMKLKVMSRSCLVPAANVGVCTGIRILSTRL